MKIKNINKRLIAGLLGGVILTTPITFSSCSSFSYKTEEDGNVHLDSDKTFDYDNVKELEIVVLEVHGQESIYLGEAPFYNLIYSDVFTGKTIYDDQGDKKTSGVKLISNETIERYLISYNMLKDRYSKEDLELLFKKIKNDYYKENNKELIKK